jgi:hypothetical protein
LNVPEGIRGEGFEYFLEVSVAMDVLEVLKGKPVSNQDKTKLLLHYAEDDVYPDWVHRL